MEMKYILVGWGLLLTIAGRILAQDRPLQYPLVKLPANTVVLAEPNEAGRARTDYLKFRGEVLNDSVSVEAKLAAHDIAVIDSLLQACLRHRNQAVARQGQPQRTIDAAGYWRQFIAGINKEGEKVVWVNCFCRPDESWRKYPVTAYDGGKCYFSVKLNLAQRKWYGFRMNNGE